MEQHSPGGRRVPRVRGAGQPHRVQRDLETQREHLIYNQCIHQNLDSRKIILSTISRYHDRGLSKLFAVVVKSSQWQFLLISPKLLICCPSPDCRSDILFPGRLPQDTFADWKFLLNSSSCEIYINFRKQKRKFV